MEQPKEYAVKKRVKPAKSVWKTPVIAFCLVLCLCIVAGVLSSDLGRTHLWMKSGDEVDNEFEVPYYAIKIEERFVPFEKWTPGMVATKEVYFTNTGEMDALLRVSCREAWRATDGTVLDNTFDHDGNESTPKIPVVHKNWTKQWTTGSAGEKEWVDGGDGYFYYTKILKAGGATVPILSSIQLHAQAPGRYSNAGYTLAFKAESVISGASPQSIGAFWGKTPAINNQNVTW